MAPRQVAKQKKVDKAEDRAKITMVIGDRSYPLYIDEITPRIELDLFKATGLALSEVLYPESWTRPLIASVVYLSRRVGGDRVTWDQVADGTPWPSEVGIRFGETPEDPDPKALATS